jgi:heterodisulfide reductase subunit B
MAAEYDESIRSVCQTLDIGLAELEDWNCCGASSAHFLDEELATQLAGRNLMIAEREGRDLLIPCAACFQRLKHADKEFKKEKRSGTVEPYQGRTTLYHVNDFLDRPNLVSAIKRKVKRPLYGLAGVAYYGCLSQRPPRVTDSPQPENPTSMDNLLLAIGMTVCPWSYKTDCCGGSLAVARTDLVRKLSATLFEAAREAGAECLVTDCPLCQSNLDTRQADIEVELGQRFNLPVFYVTELLALALGEGQAARWWKKHFVDPTPLLASKGLLGSTLAPVSPA